MSHDCSLSNNMFLKSYTMYFGTESRKKEATVSRVGTSGVTFGTQAPNVFSKKSRITSTSL